MTSSLSVLVAGPLLTEGLSYTLPNKHNEQGEGQNGH